MTGQTYRAAQAVGGGKLELATLPMREPGAGEVRIRVEACGICGRSRIDQNQPISSPGLRSIRPSISVPERIAAIVARVIRLGKKPGASAFTRMP